MFPLYLTFGKVIITSTAQISNGIITAAQIADLAVTSAKIGSLDAAKITAGTLDVERFPALGQANATVFSNSLTRNGTAARPRIFGKSFMIAVLNTSGQRNGMLSASVYL